MSLQSGVAYAYRRRQSYTEAMMKKSHGASLHRVSALGESHLARALESGKQLSLLPAFI